jgi:hypothetical protein
MKLYALILLIILSNNSFGAVENCHRKAKILNGLVNHHWLKTDTKTAGMGSGQSSTLIGDRIEAPYATLVYVVDHSEYIAKSCVEVKDIDEDCVNEELDLGKPLGSFSLLNNCQSFVEIVLKKCSTKIHIYHELSN